MFCPGCGRGIFADVFYCPFCGAATGGSGRIANMPANSIRTGYFVRIGAHKITTTALLLSLRVSLPPIGCDQIHVDKMLCRVEFTVWWMSRTSVSWSSVVHLYLPLGLPMCSRQVCGAHKS